MTARIELVGGPDDGHIVPDVPSSTSLERDARWYRWDGRPPTLYPDGTRVRRFRLYKESKL